MAAAAAAAAERIPVPGGQGCYIVADAEACCLFKDGRDSAEYGGQDCVPAMNGTSFDVGDPTVVSVCQPSCWARGTCGEAADQSPLVDSCAAAPPADAGVRMPVPGGQGCAAVTDRAACCRFVDGRPGGAYGGQECVPARTSATFDVGDPLVEVVCQPRCWADGACGDGGNQSARAGFCVAPPVAPLPGTAVVSQSGARVAAGGDLRVYVIGSSNAAWQNWPDQLHAMLRRLGYAVHAPSTGIPGEIDGPFGRRTPKCEDAASYETLRTPRLGMQGWATWGFAYESEDDCENGYRDIAGWNVSCTNGWECRPKWRGDVPILPPSAIAKGVKDVDVVVISNFVNDAKTAMYCPDACFGGPDAPDVMATTDISAENLKRTIRAIHAENPDVVVLVLARYADAKMILYVNDRNLAEVNAINAAIKDKLQDEPNTHFVDLTFPLDINMFQTLNGGHANCRGDRLMAQTVVEAMFKHKILAKGLDFGDDDTCLGRADCSSLSSACCQRSASCYVAADGNCTRYGPGLQ